MFQEDENTEHKPDHYKIGGIEVIDIIKAKLGPEEFNGFLWGNIIKYILRWKYAKDSIQGQTSDLRKAMIYLEWLIFEEEKKFKTDNNK